MPNAASSYLALIENETQVDALAQWFEKNREKKGKTSVLSLHLEVDVLLEQKGIAFQRISEFVNPEEFQQKREEARKLAREWGDSLFRQAFTETVLFPDYLSLFIHAILIAHLLEKVFQKYSESILLVFPKRAVYYLLWTRPYLTEGIFYSLLWYQIKKERRRYLKVTGGSIFLKLKEPFKLLNILLEQFFHCVKEGKRVKQLFPPQINRADLLFVGWGFDLERSLSFHHLKSSLQLASLKVVHCEIKKQQAKGKTEADFQFLTDNYPTICEYLFGFLCKRFIGKFLRFLFSYKKRDKLEFPFLFQNKTLFAHFFRFFTVLDFKVFQIQRYSQELLTRLKPRILIVSDVDFLIQRTLILTAKNLGIKVMTVNHGCYDHWFYSEAFLGDYLALWGEGCKKYLEFSDVKGAAMTVVGNPTYEYGKKGKEKREEILIVTPGISFSWSDRLEMEKNFSDKLEELTHFLANRSEKTLIKSHPTIDYHLLYEKIAKKYPHQVIHHRSTPIADILPHCKMVILFGFVSTVILDCLPYQIPILFYGGVFPHEKKMIPYIGEVGAYVSSLKEFQAVYKNIFQDMELYQAIVQKGKKYFISYTNYGKKDLFVDSLLKIYQQVA